MLTTREEIYVYIDVKNEIESICVKCILEEKCLKLLLKRICVRAGLQVISINSSVQLVLCGVKLSSVCLHCHIGGDVQFKKNAEIETTLVHILPVSEAALRTTVMKELACEQNFLSSQCTTHYSAIQQRCHSMTH